MKKTLILSAVLLVLAVAAFAGYTSLNTKYNQAVVDLAAANSQIETLTSDLADAEAQAAQLLAENESLRQTIAKAKIEAEILSSVFLPPLTGEEVNPLTLMLTLTSQIEELDDDAINEKFKALSSGDTEDAVNNLFILLFQSLVARLSQ